MTDQVLEDIASMRRTAQRLRAERNLAPACD